MGHTALRLHPHWEYSILPHQRKSEIVTKYKCTGVITFAYTAIMNNDIGYAVSIG